MSISDKMERYARFMEHVEVSYGFLGENRFNSSPLKEESYPFTIKDLNNFNLQYGGVRVTGETGEGNLLELIYVYKDSRAKLQVVFDTGIEGFEVVIYDAIATYIFPDGKQMTVCLTRSVVDKLVRELIRHYEYNV